MADVKTQVEDLIGIVGDDTLITEAANAATREIVSLTPEDRLHYFLDKSVSIDSATATQIGDRRNLSVWRAGIECVEVERGLENRVTDSSSMYYATNDNPIYILDADGVTIKPDPAAVPNDAYIYSISIPAVAENTTVPIAGVPDGAEYLIIYGTAIKCIQRLLSDARNAVPVSPASPTLLTTSAVSGLPNPPPTVTLDDNSVSFSDAAPLYIIPVFNPPIYPTGLDELDMPDPPTAPEAVASGIASDISSPPTYTGPTVAPNYGDADNWINVEEDDVMAAARLNVISAKLTQFQAEIQDATNVFSKENTEYQAKLQVALQNAQTSDAKEARVYQKYQMDIAKYQQESSNVLNKWQSEVFEMNISKWHSEYTLGIQKYQQDITSNLNTFNADLSKYQTNFQKAIKDAELSSVDSQNILAKYGNEIQSYQSEVQTKISQTQINVDRVNKANTDKLARYQADIQKFGGEVQKSQAKHQQLLQESSTLSQLYSQNLLAYIGVQQQQQQQTQKEQ